jgi:putative ABC transport system substrate-binding protein
VAIQNRLAENQIERLSALATEWVRRQVAAIAGPITSALVAKAATTTIPIVFVSGEDPVTATRTCPKRLGSPCSSIRPIPRPPRPTQVEVLDASTSREIDGEPFFSRTARRILRGRRPAFRTPAITI